MEQLTDAFDRDELGPASRIVAPSASDLSSGFEVPHPAMQRD